MFFLKHFGKTSPHNVSFKHLKEHFNNVLQCYTQNILINEENGHNNNFGTMLQ